MKEIKTNAMRLLEQKKISFEVVEYEFDEEKRIITDIVPK